MNFGAPKNVVTIDVVIALIVFLVCVFLSCAMHSDTIAGFATG